MIDFAVSQEFAARDAAIVYPTVERFPNREERFTALEEYRRATSQLRIDFGAALAEEHLSEIPETHRQEIGEQAFRYAWSEGHSSGYQSVESVYTDIAEMILTAYRLGRD